MLMSPVWDLSLLRAHLGVTDGNACLSQLHYKGPNSMYNSLRPVVCLFFAKNRARMVAQRLPSEALRRPTSGLKTAGKRS